MARMLSPVYKVTYTDGVVREHASSMYVHIAIERRWPIEATVNDDGKLGTFKPRPEVEMVSYAAWLSAGEPDTFDEWAKTVVTVEEAEPKTDPTPPAAGDG